MASAAPPSNEPPQPQLRPAGSPDTDPSHPLSHERLSTPLRPGIPPVGLLVHAYNCQLTSCAVPNCFQTKGMVTSLTDHNARCPNRRDIDPKKPPAEKNTCKPFRLYEALQRTRRRRDLMRRSTAAMQHAAPGSTTTTWQTALQSQNPAEVKRALQQHVNLCSNPIACAICTRIRDHHRSITSQCLEGDANFPPGLFAGLYTSPGDPGPGNYDQDGVECTGEQSLEERNARGFASAIELEGDDNGEDGASAERPNKLQRRSPRLAELAAKAAKAATVA